MSYDFKPFEAKIKQVSEKLTKELAGVRTGRATPAILDSVQVESYGTRMGLNQVANISVEDARTLRVIPWDGGLSKAIEKGIIDADLGVGVATDDQGLRISFPELTSERRTQLMKLAGDKTEQAKVTLRSHRTDALKALEAAEDAGGMGEDEVARLKAEIQKFIDAGNVTLLEILKRKETEIAQ